MILVQLRPAVGSTMVSLTKWSPSPRSEDLHLLLFKGPSCQLRSPLLNPPHQLGFLKPWILSAYSPYHLVGRGACAPRGLPTSPSQLQLSPGVPLPRKCKEFYQTATPTSRVCELRSLLLFHRRSCFSRTQSISGHEDNRLASSTPRVPNGKERAQRERKVRAHGRHQ